MLPLEKSESVILERHIGRMPRNKYEFIANPGTVGSHRARGTFYNHHRYYESLNNLTSADVYFGRGETIILERERIKRKATNQRRLQHRKSAA